MLKTENARTTPGAYRLLAVLLYSDEGWIERSVEPHGIVVKFKRGHARKRFNRNAHDLTTWLYYLQTVGLLVSADKVGSYHILTIEHPKSTGPAEGRKFMWGMNQSPNPALRARDAS